MKKLLLCVVTVLMLTVISLGTVYATGLSSGPSPRQQTHSVTLQLPAWVAIYIPNDVTFDLTGVSWSDTLFPKYYFPTSPATSPHEVVWYWTNNSSGAKVEVKGSGDFSSSILLNQLYHAPAGESKTADGTATPGGNWVAFSTADVQIASSSGPGRRRADQDYEFKWEHDDEYVATATVTITYTVTANP